jgi:hypothetical protein
MIYTFSEEDSRKAYEEWGANCGPNALAFALQTTLAAVRPHIREFPARRYTSPTMMEQALYTLGRRVQKITSNPRARSAALAHMFHERPALVRVQWTGPWIVDGKPQKWAARQTHWICCWRESDNCELLFDVNGGIMSPELWQAEIRPAITATVKRADGGWYPANIWRLLP